MTNFVVAGANVTLESAKTKLEYSRGDFIEIFAAEDGNVYVRYHDRVPVEVKEGDTVSVPIQTETKANAKMTTLADGRLVNINGKLLAKVGENLLANYSAKTSKIVENYFSITTESIFKPLLDSVFFREEFDEKPVYEAMSVNDLIVKEKVSLPSLSRYLSEATGARQGRNVKVPVYKRRAKLSYKDKVAKLSEQKVKTPVNAIRITGIKLSEDRSITKLGYYFDKASLDIPVRQDEMEVPFESFYYSTPQTNWRQTNYTERFECADNIDLSENLEQYSQHEGLACVASDGQRGSVKFLEGVAVCCVPRPVAEEFAIYNVADNSVLRTFASSDEAELWMKDNNIVGYAIRQDSNDKPELGADNRADTGSGIDKSF